MSHDPQLAARNRKVTRNLIGAITGMFVFGFAAVPFYGYLCTKFGIGPVSAAKAEPGIIPTKEERYVTVRFLNQVNAGLKAKASPAEPAMRLKVGVPDTVQWTFHNLSDKPIEFQAIYSVAPEKALAHLDKIECFCFNRMTMKPNETLTMPVTLRVDPELPKSVREMTLAYTLYALNPDVELIREGQRKSIEIHDKSHQ